MKKTILITGASRGFGKIWADAFLQRGDNVVITSRNIDHLLHLSERYGKAVLPLQLDITSKADCIAAVDAALVHFGQIDVLINNAGYSVFGTIEENSEREVRDLFDANVFGTLWMTQAILPAMRARGKGHIIQLSSVLGINALPTMGIYSATKFAVEGFSEALQAEVKDFGIHVTLVEPNSFKTDFFGSSAVTSQPMQVYQKITDDFKNGDGLQPENIGDPKATIDAIQTLVDAKEPPLRLFLGKLAFPWTEYTYAEKLKSWGQWNNVAHNAHGH